MIQRSARVKLAITDARKRDQAPYVKPTAHLLDLKMQGGICSGSDRRPLRRVLGLLRMSRRLSNNGSINRLRGDDEVRRPCWESIESFINPSAQSSRDRRIWMLLLSRQSL